MRGLLRFFHALVCLVGVSWPGAEIAAVESYDFGFEFESALVPGLDETSTILGATGDSVPFAIHLDLGVASTDAQPSGVFGWSFGVWTAGFDIDSISVGGTLAASSSLGGLLNPDASFLVYWLVDPEENDGRHGVFQAVVLNFIEFPPSLPPGHRYRVGRIDCRARLDGEPRRGFARYDNQLRNPPSPPVGINLTVGGSDVPVGRGHREIAIGADAPLEICDDGSDNDRDGFADLADPDCSIPLPAEICDDGIDNDGDEAVDCDDSHCIGDGACPRREICGDGLDNDRDGLSDCDDAACEGHPYCLARELCDDGIDNDDDGLVDCEDRDCGGIEPCPVIERCFDFVDNDDDGLLDCDDPDCFGVSVCGVFEVCADGVDNNGDGLVDCEDPQCSDGPSCVVLEDCEDGIDNDDDGFVDCDDTQCAGVGLCPVPERCADGIDNDRDGLVDCDDPDCSQLDRCRDPEICDDGVDNDEDRRTDCDDPDCLGRGPCPGPEQCSDEQDNDQDGLVDCLDEDCQGSARCRVEICGDGVDNDVDSLVDCDDPDCLDLGDCMPEICDNGVDDDGDGLVDCDDPFCSIRGLCVEGAAGFDLVLAAPGAVRVPALVPGDGEVAQVNARVLAEAHNLVEIPADGPGRVEVTAYIVPFPVAQPTGAQGWSVSVVHTAELLDVVEGPTIQGTDAEAALTNPSFEVTEEVQPDENGDGQIAGGEELAGVISAVVLSFAAPATLDPSVPQSVLRTTYEFTGAADPASPAILRFQDGLRIAPSPGVVNSITIDGSAVEPLHRIPLAIPGVGDSGLFVRGDANGDSSINIADAVVEIHTLLRAGPPIPCPSAADANGDGRLDLMDPVHVVQYLFLRGLTPPAPYPECGPRDAELDLPCPVNAQPGCVL